MPSTPSTFPVKLLAESKAKRMEYFKTYIARHPHQQDADARLWRAIHSQMGKPLIFVFGPPGVGKTTLCDRIQKRLQHEVSNELLSPEERRRSSPVLHIEATAPDNGNFNWRDFYQRSIATLEEPFVSELKKDYIPRISVHLAHALAYNQRLPYCEFRLSLEHALKYRRPAAFLIDDAQHIAKMASGRRLLDQMDVLKSISSKSNTLLVLLGTYELLAFRNLSGQLSRRSIDIHFRRYNTGAKDIEAFHNVLWSFQRHLPLAVEPNLMKYWEYCYVHSIGCVGILKDWLTEALYNALEDDAKTITIQMLERYALSIDQCEILAAEAIEGEARISNHSTASARLMQLLGFTQSRRKQMPIPVEAQTEEPESKSKAKIKIKPQVPRPVGRRKARRDPVG